MNEVVMRKFMRMVCVVILSTIFVACSIEDANQIGYSTEGDITNSSNDSELDVQSVNVEDEVEFKSLCQEFDIKSLDKKSVGMLVTKDLILGSPFESEEGYTRYTCGAIEDFLEEIDMYQHTYRVYKIKDFQLQKDFPFKGNDVVRVYGIIESVSKSY